MLTTNLIINGTEMPILEMESKISVFPDTQQVVFYGAEAKKELEALSNIGFQEPNYALFVPKMPQNNGDKGIGVIACITDTDGIETDENGLIQAKVAISGITRAYYTISDIEGRKAIIDQVIFWPKGKLGEEEKNLMEKLEKLIRHRCVINGENYQKSIYKMIIDSNGSPEEILYEDLRNFPAETYDLEAASVLAQEFMVSDNQRQLELLVEHLEKEIEKASSEMGFGTEAMNSSMPDEEISKIMMLINRISSLEPRKEQAIKTIMSLYGSVPDYCFRTFLRQLEVAGAQENQSSEGQSALQYIETVLAFPWGVYSDKEVPPREAAEILHSSHYGMEEVKEKILEYIASLKFINNPSKAQILCLVGPPGVGKTSIAKTIAKAVGREFVKVSLAGVADDHAIKGHRKTYVASMPGMIVTALKRAKVSNPVMLLDEIDKLGDSGRGNPADALLEVLDPEQNKEFEDHYMNMPTDISRTLFICTANYLERIPAALKDRLTIVNLPGYTSKERFHIAKEFLIPNALKEHALEGKAEFNDDAIRALVTEYTREAGVRNLGRGIDDVCKKILKKVVFEDAPLEDKMVIDASIIDEMMKNQKKYELNRNEAESVVGRVNGLAWTAVGGCTLPLEVVLTPSKNHKMLVTGNLGNVMKESMTTALTVAKNALRGTKFLNKLENSTIHIHAPEGAVPKDGPSAGITAVTAIVSAITEIPVPTNIAMTGEVSLLGEVMPIGGLTEKLTAAVEVGCDTIVIPKRNRREYEMALTKNSDISKLNINETRRIEEVLAVVFGKDWAKKIKEQEKKLFKKSSSAQKAT
ncbi:MAG: endopeptidase La [Phototrophicales bacterium]|nr:MAG: endopeptidase La [Phototrophicales bacterium]